MQGWDEKHWLKNGLNMGPLIALITELHVVIDILKLLIFAILMLKNLSETSLWICARAIFSRGVSIIKCLWVFSWVDTVKVGIFTFWVRLKLSASFLVWRSACYRSVSMLNLSPWGRFRATWLRGGNFLIFFFSLPQPQNVLADIPSTQGHGWH